MVPAREATVGYAGYFLSFRFFRKSEVDSRQLKVKDHDLQSRLGSTTFRTR